MARVMGACLSARAWGTLGRAITYQRRRSGQVAYGYRVPRDLRTVAQGVVRDEILDLRRRWRAMDAEYRDWWLLDHYTPGTSPFANFTLECFAQQ